IEQIATICNATWVNKNKNLKPLAYLSLDSRKINFPEYTVFFAVKNDQRNANTFLSTLYKKGVRNFVTDEIDLDISALSSTNIIRVADTVRALQDLAAHHRNQFKNLSVIGITGSNGKTIVKEWLNQILNDQYIIVRSPKSFNSQIGVPLSVLNIKSQNTLGIFEAGISANAEMENLERIINPTIGIITNIGNAHDEGFKNRRQKIKEKLLLFKNSSHLIFCSEYEDLKEEILSFAHKKISLKIFSWGKSVDNVLRILSTTKRSDATIIKAVYLKKSFSITIPFTDDASIENAINCWCVLFILYKVTKANIDKFNHLYAMAMRLELKPGTNGCNIINDSYSNDLHSLTIALDFLDQQKNNPKRTVILSDILESGVKAKSLYLQVAGLFQQKKIDNFIGIGAEISANRNAFSFINSATFFASTDEFLAQANSNQFYDETILIKGARQFGFEKISRLLELKIHQTVLEINLTNLAYNLRKYKEKIHGSTKIMAMVKAFGYGSGSHEIASVLEFNKVDYLAVAYIDEGIALRKNGITLPVMIMNIDNSTFDSLVNYKLEPEIFSLDLLNDLLNYLSTRNIKNFPIHLKIDTGMHRLGFMENEIESLCKKIEDNAFIKIQSVFSHLSSSDYPQHDDFTLQQSKIFESCCGTIEKTLGYSFDKHISNSAAISRLPQLQYDMVRLG
ncbi:MAG: bifunctional UDP-N-acetylmuramoyl-tripeptide:D-alanyl-D-alanine ligase/alanine racemase, partial [Ginsengibacter sp.]